MHAIVLASVVPEFMPNTALKVSSELLAGILSCSESLSSMWHPCGSMEGVKGTMGKDVTDGRNDKECNVCTEITTCTDPTSSQKQNHHHQPPLLQQSTIRGTPTQLLSLVSSFLLLYSTWHTWYRCCDCGVVDQQCSTRACCGLLSLPLERVAMVGLTAVPLIQLVQGCRDESFVGGQRAAGMVGREGVSEAGVLHGAAFVGMLLLNVSYFLDNHHTVLGISVLGYALLAGTAMATVAVPPHTPHSPHTLQQQEQLQQTGSAYARPALIATYWHRDAITWGNVMDALRWATFRHATPRHHPKQTQNTPFDGGPSSLSLI